jgi:hypothetical protein
MERKMLHKSEKRIGKIKRKIITKMRTKLYQKMKHKNWQQNILQIIAKKNSKNDNKRW